VERRKFNESVRDYNTACASSRARSSPLLRLQARPFFEAAPDAATVPKVKFYACSSRLSSPSLSSCRPRRPASVNDYAGS